MSPLKQSHPSSISIRRHMSPTLVAWCSVFLVVIVIAVLVVIKLTSTGGPTASSHQAVRPASATLVRGLSTVPTSVFDTVGVDIPSQFAGDPPIVIRGQPALTLNGRAPSMMYFGAEFCPFCAAQRWGMAVALARFGTWSGLDTTASGLQDGDFSTLSFRDAKLTSRYVNFVPIETCTNVVDPSVDGCSGYKPLQRPSNSQQAVLNKYAGPAFVPSNAQGIHFPYIDVDNKVLYSGSTYEPAVLTGLSQTQIVAGLTDPTNIVTRSIIGTSNYIAASICAGTKGAPADVCDSSGVQKADAALRIVSANG
jgi:Domain of unknown function (DUF929)